MRGELLQERRSLRPEQIESARAAVRDHVLAAVAAADWGCVAAFVPLRTEPGSTELLDRLVAAGHTVIVPITLDDHDLDWTLWVGGAADRAAEPLGTDAIARADLVLVPALAVAHDGTRLGRGGGSYDRALNRVRAQAPVVAVLYDTEVRAELPREAWDVPVNGYVTPSGWHLLA